MRVCSEIGSQCSDLHLTNLHALPQVADFVSEIRDWVDDPNV